MLLTYHPSAAVILQKCRTKWIKPHYARGVFIFSMQNKASAQFGWYMFCIIQWLVFCWSEILVVGHIMYVQALCFGPEDWRFPHLAFDFVLENCTENWTQTCWCHKRVYFRLRTIDFEGQIAFLPSPPQAAQSGCLHERLTWSWWLLMSPSKKKMLRVSQRAASEEQPKVVMALAWNHWYSTSNPQAVMA